MEQVIICRAKFLMFHYGKDMDESIEQAIEEVGDKEQLIDLYRLYDMTKQDYVKYIKRKMRGEL